MAQFRISPAHGREELMKLITDSGWWACEDKEAENLLAYIAGALDMANAIIRRYEGGSEE